jgi:hypothetical protein
MIQSHNRTRALKVTWYQLAWENGDSHPSKVNLNFAHTASARGTTRIKIHTKHKNFFMTEICRDFDIRKQWTDHSSLNSKWLHPMGLFYNRSGNTKAIISTLYDIRTQFALSILFVPDDETRTAYGTVFEDCCIFVGDDPDSMERVVQEVQKVMHHLKVSQNSTEDGQEINALLVVDNCPKLLNTGALKQMACNCRNDHITLMVGTKHYVHVPATFRVNTDYFVAGAIEDAETRQTLYDDFWNDVKRTDFEQLYANTTQNHDALVWTNANTDRPTDKFFAFKPIHCMSDFRLTSPININSKAAKLVIQCLDNCKRSVEHIQYLRAGSRERSH